MQASSPARYRVRNVTTWSEGSADLPSLIGGKRRSTNTNAAYHPAHYYCAVVFPLYFSVSSAPLPLSGIVASIARRCAL